MLTRKNLEKLCENCKQDPERIGIAVLRMLGYKVETYRLSGAVYVFSKDGKKVVYADNGACVD